MLHLCNHDIALAVSRLIPGMGQNGNREQIYFHISVDLKLALSTDLFELARNICLDLVTNVSLKWFVIIHGGFVVTDKSETAEPNTARHRNNELVRPARQASMLCTRFKLTPPSRSSQLSED